MLIDMSCLNEFNRMDVKNPQIRNKLVSFGDKPGCMVLEWS